MSRIVRLSDVRHARRLEELLADWERRLSGELPAPEVLGWREVGHDENGRCTRWFQPRYQALVGFLADRPGLVFLDYKHRCLAFDCSPQELMVGLESGILPRVVHELDSATPAPTGPHLSLVEPDE